MAETLISPGVFLQENDASQITQGPITAGAAIIGPTVSGPVNIPTVVTTYSQYKSIFGAAFVSGGATYEYLTSIAALNYFEQGGTSLIVTRVASGSYTPATSVVPSGIGIITASATLNLTSAATTAYTASFNGVNVILSGSSVQNVYNNATSSINSNATINSSASFSTPNLVVTANTIGLLGNTYYYTSGSTTVYYSGGTNQTAFTLETLSVGAIMNNSGSMTAAYTASGALPSGSASNIRWEVTGANSGSGVFSIIVRQGDDNNNSKTILETWNNLSLDPNQNNYIGYVIGDQTQTVTIDSTGNYFLQTTGSYANKSNYVRVKSVNLPTPGYFDQNGNPQTQYTASIPLVGNAIDYGAFTGATGPIYGCFGLAPLNMFEAIPTNAATTNANNVQGLQNSSYNTAINLLGNQDAYDFNVIYAPGLTSQNAASQVSAILNLAQTRGDNIAVIDMVGYGSQINSVINQAVSYDNSYGATYWPWVQVRSRETGKINFVPASTLVPAVYEYNDRVSAEWFAPAGLNRGALSTVLQPERKLTVNDRNLLYQGKVNPIATFPGVGTVIYGQKTLQQKPSALDRVNVRRLLIALKNYIGQLGENIVFEPNTQVTRNKFLNQVNPYLESVQQRQGLYAFQVIMDETNNTPDVVDRNQLVGTIYLQPTKTAEFIQLNFNILPTGATFGQ
jgi:phage tail sheath protein FI